ncbi:MAG: hypothetical protein JSS72_05095 [Armatimonadetes bacterium]|nr:hypothetical protein [Armatimonadota bacterium]
MSRKPRGDELREDEAKQVLISAELHRRLYNAAWWEERSLPDLIEFITGNWLDQRERERGKKYSKARGKHGPGPESYQSDN